MKALEKIETIHDVETFAKWLCEERDVEFHPDGDFADYISIETGEQVFSEEESVHLNNLMEQCFELCDRAGMDVYEVMGNVCVTSRRLSFNPFV